MIQTTQKGKLTELFATEGYLHRKGDKEYAKVRRICILAPDSPDDYEEISFERYEAGILEKYKKEQYAKRLSAAIHERYSIDDEIALAANVNSQTLLSDEDKAAEIYEEYEAYQQYRELCKSRVRAEIDAITEVPEEGEGNG